MAEHKELFKNKSKFVSILELILYFTDRPDLECSDNKDDAEDVLGALDETIKLNWSSKNRLIFNLADSPHHGKNISR